MSRLIVKNVGPIKHVALDLKGEPAYPSPHFPWKQLCTATPSRSTCRGILSAKLFLPLLRNAPHNATRGHLDIPHGNSLALQSSIEVSVEGHPLQSSLYAPTWLVHRRVQDAVPVTLITNLPMHGIRPTEYTRADAVRKSPLRDPQRSWSEGCRAYRRQIVMSTIADTQSLLPFILV